jgi:hypothetical protein
MFGSHGLSISQAMFLKTIENKFDKIILTLPEQSPFSLGLI